MALVVERFAEPRGSFTAPGSQSPIVIGQEALIHARTIARLPSVA
jgi:hypothetical protein